MAKEKTVFVCVECGYESARWMGKCPSCDNWNSMAEEASIVGKKEKKAEKSYRGATLQKLGEVHGDEGGKRLKSGIGELDRVLGGGFVRGSAVLLGGDPGIGKSTLLMQVCQNLCQSNELVYISGEESAAQIKMRAARIGKGASSYDDIYLLCETDLDAIEKGISKIGADVIIIDSVQTMYSAEASGTQGSISQVRQATSTLSRIAKTTGAVIIIVGHVTKQGAIAGPKVLEHLVDTVLYFEGDRNDQYRMLRAVKNRFGSTNEIGVFEMTGVGMKEVTNPSDLFLTERTEPVPGCAIACVVEGTRCILSEVQALCSKSSFGNARRMSAGIDYNRLALICAVIEKKLGLPLYEMDIYVNVVGGLKIEERAVDLAVCSAIVSSYLDKPIRGNIAVCGEIGLTGEVRGIAQIEKRVSECARLGCEEIWIPAVNNKGIKNKNIKINIVNSVADAIKRLIG